MLAEGCTGSTAVHDIAVHLASQAFPSRRVAGTGEAWHLAAQVGKPLDSLRVLNPDNFTTEFTVVSDRRFIFRSERVSRHSRHSPQSPRRQPSAVRPCTSREHAQPDTHLPAQTTLVSPLFQTRSDP